MVLLQELFNLFTFRAIRIRAYSGTIISIGVVNVQEPDSEKAKLEVQLSVQPSEFDVVVEKEKGHDVR